MGIKLASVVLLSAMLFAMPADANAKKKPKLVGTEWVFSISEQVLDAGNMVFTVKIAFLDKKNVEITTINTMSAHPAPYVLANGEVPMIPASRSETVKKGTYRQKRNSVFITVENDVTEYKLKQGALCKVNPRGEEKYELTKGDIK